MNENNGIDPKVAKPSENIEIEVTATASVPTGGNVSSNGTVVNEINVPHGDDDSSVDANKAVPRPTRAATTTATATVSEPPTIETMSTNNGLHNNNRSSATQSNWVQFDSDESPVDIKVCARFLILVVSK